MPTNRTVTDTAPAAEPDRFTHTIADQYGDTATGKVYVTASNRATVISAPPYGSEPIGATISRSTPVRSLP